jgi:hypothetical protein
VADVDGGQEGSGMYGLASLPLGPVRATVEAKRYRKLDLIYGADLVTYNRPPTLEPEDLLFFQPAEAGETQGTRLILASDLPGFPLGASCSLARITGGSGFEALHGIASLTWSRPASTLVGVSGGVRREEWGGYFDWASGTWLHAALRLVQPLGRGHALEAGGRLLQARREEEALSPEDWEAHLAYSFAPTLQVSARYEHKET